MSLKSLRLPFYVFLLIISFLSFVQLKLENPIILLERFVKNGGWFEIFFVGIYGAFIAYKIQEPGNTAKWRMIAWKVFTFVFFAQLALGLAGSGKFLMTGKLHLPVPMMIIGGPVYRGELSVMTILFLSTILVTGPAWCSQFCYFGALDNMAASGKKPGRGRIRNRQSVKFTVLVLVIIVALVLRWLNINIFYSTMIAGLFGLAGLAVILLVSTRKGKMIHCLTWCPVGTVVNYTRYVNPFRMYIDTSTCTLCNICTSHCRYDALNRTDIEKGRPDITCTLCGDCLPTCHAGSIKYKFLKMDPEKARNLYLVLTVSLHAIFLALGRI